MIFLRTDDGAEKWALRLFLRDDATPEESTENIIGAHASERGMSPIARLPWFSGMRARRCSRRGPHREGCAHLLRTSLCEMD